MRQATRLSRTIFLSSVAIAAATIPSLRAFGDTVTDWNDIAVRATKGWNGTTGAGVVLDTNLATRVEAIAARAVFDAVNSIDHFSPGAYAYSASNSGSAAAAAAQAAHDVLLAQLPDPAADSTADARWGQPRAWVDAQLASTLGALGVGAGDGGIAAGQAAAAAENLARALDNAAPVTSYGAALGPATNPGVGLWRQSNAAPGIVNPVTGAPTGFDAAGVIQGRPAVDLNWRDVVPFSLTVRQQLALIADVSLPLAAGGLEYGKELDFVRRVGQDTSTARTADQTDQALFYKQDAEIFVNEAARIASQTRGFGIDQNAKLFALLGNALADTRVAAFASKYEQKFWRPITALNADPSGAVTNGHAAWHPLAATPSHPSNTSGHSATGAAGFEILRAVFGDAIRPDGRPATLTSLPWLAGTNSGTGSTTSRSVTRFSQVQLENGASRIYLGVHFGFDNLQGQLLGLAVADTILRSRDPAAAGVWARGSAVSGDNLVRTLVARPDLYGYFGRLSSRDE